MAFGTISGRPGASQGKKRLLAIVQAGWNGMQGILATQKRAANGR